MESAAVIGLFEISNDIQIFVPWVQGRYIIMQDLKDKLQIC